MKIDWKRLRERIDAHQRFVLTSHVRPDADAIGSELGMAGVLAALGKKVRIVNPHPTPRHLEFLDPQRQVEVLGREATAEQVLANTDAFLVLDTSAWAQLGDMGQVLKKTTATKLVLDHHVSADDLGAEEFKDPKAEATGRLVEQAAREFGITLTPEQATALFVALATDTGWFRFGSTTSGTYECAARLIASGASPSAAYASLYEHDSLARIQLTGRVLARTELLLDGRLAVTAALADDFAATRAERSDTEDVVNMTLRVAGTQAAVIFVEQEDGTFKVSLRSRSTVCVNQIAEVFGGGGHHAAAGANLDGPYEAARARMLDAVRAAMQ